MFRNVVNRVSAASTTTVLQHGMTRRVVVGQLYLVCGRWTGFGESDGRRPGPSALRVGGCGCPVLSYLFSVDRY